MPNQQNNQITPKEYLKQAIDVIGDDFTMQEAQVYERLIVAMQLQHFAPLLLQMMHGISLPENHCGDAVEQ